MTGPVAGASESSATLPSGGAVAERLLIALDVDGTVILADESPSPGVVDAVARAREAGHEVMIATGRNWDGTRPILVLLGIEPDYVVCANGAVIMRRTGEGVYERFLVETFDPTDVLQLLVEHIPEAHFVVELPDGRRRYTEILDEWHLVRAEQVPFERLADDPVARVVVVSPTQSQEDFLAVVHRIGLTEVTYSVGWTAWLDIAPAGVDKGSGLAHVVGWLGGDPSRVLVIGDGHNDVGMFAWALSHGGRAVAMAQAPDDVRAAAGETTLSVQEGGVAAVLSAL